MEFISDNSTLKILTCGDIMIRVYGITKLHGEICFYAYKQIQNILQKDTPLRHKLT